VDAQPPSVAVASARYVRLRMIVVDGAEAKGCRVGKSTGTVSCT
jgi:hypothetical protein